MTALRRSVLLLATLLLAAVAARADDSPSPVAKLADEMQPGQWRELTSDGYDFESLMRGDDILAYTGKAAWDEKSQQVLFIGQTHLKGPPVFISYAARDNAWKRMATPPWAESLKWFHAYENNAADSAAGKFYHHSSASTDVFALDTDSGEWTKLPELKDAATGHGTALEFFPEMGGLVRVLGGGASGGSVHFWSAKTNEWKLLAEDVNMGPYHNFASYSPAKKAVLFGGGNGSPDIYLLDAEGKISAGKPAPHPLHVNQSLQVVDPASGELLVLGKGPTFHAYSPARDEWRKLPADEVPFAKYTAHSVSAAPLKGHGVVLFFSSAPQGMKTFLYRHSPANE
jgi:hypothetical protein